MNTKEKYIKKFTEEIQKLNEQQRQAIVNTGRPMMVIAGPGTGKTQVLSMRIANILQGEANVNEILCLTYTDAGAIAMRKRLSSIIGEEAAKITICTFHSFCNMVIQENGNYFQMHDLEPVSEIEHFKIIQQIIDELPLQSKLIKLKTNTYQWIKPLKYFYETAKNENWSPKYLKAKCEEYLEIMQEDSIYRYKRGEKKGQLKPDFYTEQERILRTLEAIDTIEKHDALMLKNQRYTFQDMLLWTQKLFEDDEDILMSYQERFQYILVDEYQDTSGIQNALLFQLCNTEKPNVFVVGDDDQSIYRFQNANVENILNYKKRFQDEDLQEVVLLENYRSSQPIIDAALSLIEKNENRIVKSELKQIFAGKNNSNTNAAKPNIIEFENEIQESAHIAFEIRDLVTKNGVKPSEIAVLYKNHKYAENIIRCLQALQIEVNVRKRENLLQIPLISQIFKVMQYVSNEIKKPFSSENELFEILHYPFFKNKPLQIAKFSASLFEKAVKERRWRVQLNEIKPKQDLFSIETSDEDQLYYSFVSLEKLIRKALEQPLQLWFDTLLQELNVISLIFQNPENLFLLNAVSTLFDHIKQATAANPKLTLSQYLSEIEVMETYGIELSVSKIIGNSNGVQFTTMHSSKGLEYEYVYMIHNEASSWESKQSGMNIKLPSNLFGTLHKAEEEQASEDEKRRLFYVAMTRAKQQLNISYSVQDLNGKGLSPVSFIQELISNEKVNFAEKKLSTEEIVHFIKNIFEPQVAPVVPLIEQAYIQQKVENFKLSTTALNNFLQCPLAFYFNNIIRVPSAKSPIMTFGSIVHNVLNDAYAYFNTQNILPDINFIQQKVDKYFLKHSEVFTAKELSHQKHYAMAILQYYHEQVMPKWRKGSLTEFAIETAFDGVPIKGTLDRIDFYNDTIEIIDYKTGKFKSEKFKPAQSDDETQVGGDYWRQALFYKILLDNFPHRTWNATGASFEFVEFEEKSGEKQLHHKKVHFTTDEINIVKNQIKTTMQKIRNFEFSTGCGSKDCQWCNFVKNNYEGVKIIPNENEL